MIVVVLVLLICAGTQTCCVGSAGPFQLPSQAEDALSLCVCCLNYWGPEISRHNMANRRFSHHHHIQGMVWWC